MALVTVGSLTIGGGCAGPDVSEGASTSDSALGAGSCDVLAHGAKGDGKTDDTAALQAAIDRCPDGSTVSLPANHRFMSGMLTLKSNLTLVVEQNAALVGIQADTRFTKTYPLIPPGTNTQEANCRHAFLYANNVKNLKISGPGTIDGNGSYEPWLSHGSAPAFPTAYTGAYLAAPADSGRPVAIYIAHSENIAVDGIRLHNSGKWGMVYLEVDNLRISNVDVDSDLPGNRDGIDVVDSHHVRIDHCTVRSEDDAICFKSGSTKGVEDVVVSNCTITKSTTANGIKFGTAGYGYFRNATFQDITISNVAKTAMAIESVDGADISDIHFKRIKFDNAGAAFFLLLGNRGGTPVGSPKKIGSISNVSFEDIKGTSGAQSWGSAISGTKVDGVIHTIHGVSFVNVDVTNRGGDPSVPAFPKEYSELQSPMYPEINMWNSSGERSKDWPSFGLTLRHAQGVTFRNTQLKPSSTDARLWLALDDASGVTVDASSGGDQQGKADPFVSTGPLVVAAVINAGTYVSQCQTDFTGQNVWRAGPNKGATTASQFQYPQAIAGDLVTACGEKSQGLYPLVFSPSDSAQARSALANAWITQCTDARTMRVFRVEPSLTVGGKVAAKFLYEQAAGGACSP